VSSSSLSSSLGKRAEESRPSNDKERNMGRIVATEFISLDGVIEDPGGAEDFEHGGWTLEIGRVQGLIAADLLDELPLMVFPVVLGGGKRLFADDGQKRSLKLASAETVGDGISLVTYEKA
jgi:hypothetical protein